MLKWNSKDGRGFMAASPLFRIALAGCAFTVCATASAGPTALYLIPIADILRHREAFAYIGTSGNERNVDPRYYNFHAATVGLFDRIEIGYDNDFLGTTTYNVKLQLFDSPKQAPGLALSVGYLNANGGYREPYIVLRQDFKKYRLHGGYWRTGGVNRLMIGADFPVLNGATGAIEHLSGPGGQTWASMFVPFKSVPGLGIQVAVGFPADRADGIQHSALLFYAFKV